MVYLAFLRLTKQKNFTPIFRCVPVREKYLAKVGQHSALQWLSEIEQELQVLKHMGGNADCHCIQFWGLQNYTVIVCTTHMGV